MNYKNTLLFVADVLSLAQQPNKLLEIELQLSGGDVQWDKVLKVSSEHLVLPAICIQLELAKLMDLLPLDLQEYLQHITHLNRIRNQHNLEQVKELNNLLNSHNISPIYLKGTAHLLEGLYSDIGERMIGDIDLLVAPELMEQAADLLEELGYSPMSEYSSEDFVRTKHYPRMIHKEKVFAVEIHKDVIQKVSQRQLDYKCIVKTKRMVNGYYLPSYSNLILHNIMNTQLNDNGLILSSINLRQQYDFLLLAQIESPIIAIKNFNYHKLTLKSYLVKSAFFFGESPQMRYPKSIWTLWVESLIALKLRFPKQLKVLTQLSFIIWRILRDVRLAIEYLPN